MQIHVFRSKVFNFFLENLKLYSKQHTQTKITWSQVSLSTTLKSSLIYRIAPDMTPANTPHHVIFNHFLVSDLHKHWIDILKRQETDKYLVCLQFFFKKKLGVYIIKWVQNN